MAIKIPRPRALVMINLLVMIIYFVLLPIQFPREFVILMQSSRAAFCLMVVIVYGHSVWQTVKSGENNYAFGLTLGIMLGFLADTCSSILGLLWRLHNKPIEWTLYSIWFFPSFVTIMAAVHHIVTPGVIDGRIPQRNVIFMAIALGLLMIVATTMFAFLTIYFPNIQL